MISACSARCHDLEQCLGLRCSYFSLQDRALILVPFCFWRGWDVIILDSVLAISLVRSPSSELPTLTVK